ncbi:MAG: EAL domain-containing protein [Coprobacillus sp.]
MKWNMAAECISIVILTIIWIYSRKSSLAPSLKNKLFELCLLVTFGSMITNIVSTLMIRYLSLFPVWLTWFITLIYFILTPLMGMVYCLYSISIVYEGKPNLMKSIHLWSIPGILYVLFILSNIFTKFIFDINPINGYIQGPYVSITYIIFYAYCLISVIIVLFNHKHIDKYLFQILSSFPIIAVIVIIIQSFFPSIILSGSAATCALLIIYLHLQNRQITNDYITNLSNRFELVNTLDVLLRNKDNSFALLVLSLRDFKQVNDSYGQQNGDILLKIIGQYLSTLYRKNAVFRFKGDEYAILISDPNKEMIRNILDNIKEKFSQPWKLKDTDCLLSYVVGIVYYPETTDTLGNLILAVELAVNKAKDERSNPICYFNQEMFTNMKRRKIISDILKEKVENEDFDMYYQPIYSVKTGEFLYAESLVRILNSQIGPIMPSEFIPIAEDNGLIVNMTYSILDMVCKDVRNLIEIGIPTHCVHVNFSALQFKQPLLADKVLEIIRRNNIPCSTIKIEFTESTIAESLDNVTKFALNMKEHGISMGLDDFGTGYSNLSSVITIPFNTIKLDKSLIWAAMKEEKYALTLKNLIRIFKDLDMKIVAEGIETKEQSDFIIESGVDQIQGFYYAKPMPHDQYIQFLKEKQGIPTE